MANTADKVIAVAQKEVGYLEKKTGDLKYLYDKKANAGYANYTKYGYEMHRIYPSVMDFPAAWCDAFVDWCFYKAYGITTAKSLLGGNFDDYTVASAQMYKKKGALHTDGPKAGDQIFYSKTGSVSGIYHTGLIESVSGDTITTIEGNTSGKSGIEPNGGGVFQKKRSMSMLRGKVFFGRPSYDTAAIKSKVKTADNEEIEPAHSFSHTYNRRYKITASSLYLRRGAGTDHSIILSMPRGSYVWCYGYYEKELGEIWLLVNYNDSQSGKTVKGYCSYRWLG